MKSSSFLSLSFASLLAVSAHANEVAPLDLASFPGELINEVVVPVPAEIFSVLDKLGEPNWEEAIVEQPKSESQDRRQIALQFGCLIADGFVAVQAQSPAEIQNIGRRVLDLSESLGLASSVRPHCLSIIEAAGDKDWNRVRRELDLTELTVRETMEELRDDELSNLVSLGGWLRGTQVVTQVVTASYSNDKAELLNQPGLVNHFQGLVSTMSQQPNSPRFLRQISTGLADMNRVIKANAPLNPDQILEVRQLSTQMLAQFYL